MKSVKNLINIMFGKHLFITNVVSCSVLLATGDAIEQQLNNMEKSDHDLGRTKDMLVVGSLMAPIQHVFYKRIDAKYPCNSLKSVTKKVLLDQIILAPVLIVTFFVCSGVLENKSKECYREIKTKFFDIYMIDCCIWPPTQFLNFLFLGPRFRVMWVNCTTIIYNIFLSHIKHKEINV